MTIDSDIREVLQKAEGPNVLTDDLIQRAVKVLAARFSPINVRSYDETIGFLNSEEVDWIVGSVNGRLGGTPYACVGCKPDEASYAATPVLSLWLSYFRFKLGDERQQSPSESFCAAFLEKDGSYSVYTPMCASMEEAMEFTPYYAHGDARRRCFILLDQDGNYFELAEWNAADKWTAVEEVA